MTSERLSGKKRELKQVNISYYKEDALKAAIDWVRFKKAYCKECKNIDEYCFEKHPESVTINWADLKEGFEDLFVQ